MSFFLSIFLSFFFFFFFLEVKKFINYIIVAPFCPTFVVGNVVRLFLPTSSNTAYSLSRTGILAGFYCVPMHEDGQEQRLSSAKVVFLCLRQGHGPSAGIPASACDKTNQQSGAVFDYSFLVVLASPFLDSSRIGTATFSKQMATTSLHTSALLTRKTFLVNVQNS